MREVLAVIEAMSGIKADITWSGVYAPAYVSWRVAYGLVASPDGQPVGALRIHDDEFGLNAELTLRTPDGVRRVWFGVSRFPTQAYHRPYRAVAWWAPETEAVA